MNSCETSLKNDHSSAKFKLDEGSRTGFSGNGLIKQSIVKNLIKFYSKIGELFFKRIYEANKEMSAGLKCLKNKLVFKYI